MKLRSEQTLSAKTRIAIEYAEQDPPAHAPDYFDHLRAIVRKARHEGKLKLLLVLYARYSDRRPGKRDTTGDQLRAIKEAIRLLEQEFGVTIRIYKRMVRERVSGGRLRRQERQDLMKAVKLAEDNDAILVAYDVSRFVRNKDFFNCGTLPTVDDFERLKRLVGKVQLATLFHPKIHEHRVRSTKRGHKAKGAKPGRPPKKVKKIYRAPFSKMPNKANRVVRLRKQNMSWPEIAREVGRAESTVRGWYMQKQKQAVVGGANFSKSGQKVGVSHSKTSSILKKR